MFCSWQIKEYFCTFHLWNIHFISIIVIIAAAAAAATAVTVSIYPSFFLLLDATTPRLFRIMILYFTHGRKARSHPHIHLNITRKTNTNWCKHYACHLMKQSWRELKAFIIFARFWLWSKIEFQVWFEIGAMNTCYAFILLSLAYEKCIRVFSSFFWWCIN